VAGFRASSAISMVSLSRISPTRITSAPAEGRTQRQRKVGVSLWSPAVNRRFLMAMKKLDGVFYRQDMICLFLVDLFRNSPRSVEDLPSRSGGHQHDAIPQFRDFTEMRRQIERCEIGNRLGDHAP